jgi:hypothetical protein
MRARAFLPPAAAGAGAGGAERSNGCSRPRSNGQSKRRRQVAAVAGVDAQVGGEQKEEATEDLFQLEASGRGMCQHMPSNRLLWVRDKAHASVRVGHDLICVKDGDVEFLRELHELREHLPEVLLPH